MRLNQLPVQVTDGASSAQAGPSFGEISKGDEVATYEGIKLIWERLIAQETRLLQVLGNPATGFIAGASTIIGTLTATALTTLSSTLTGTSISTDIDYSGWPTSSSDSATHNTLSLDTYLTPATDDSLQLGTTGSGAAQKRWKAVYTSDIVKCDNVLVAGAGVYDYGRSKAMGDWTAIAHDDANFTGNVTGNADWVVDSADQVSLRYTRIGTTAILSFSIQNTDVANGPTQLRITVPSAIALVSGGRFTNDLARALDNGVLTEARAVIDSTTSTTLILILRKDGAAWTNTAADNTTVEGQLVWETAS